MELEEEEEEERGRGAEIYWRFVMNSFVMSTLQAFRHTTLTANYLQVSPSRVLILILTPTHSLSNRIESNRIIYCKRSKNKFCLKNLPSTKTSTPPFAIHHPPPAIRPSMITSISNSRTHRESFFDPSLAPYPKARLGPRTSSVNFRSSDFDEETAPGKQARRDTIRRSATRNVTLLSTIRRVGVGRLTVLYTTPSLTHSLTAIISISFPTSFSGLRFYAARTGLRLLRCA
ncbi:hypothetical protein SCHPADRAFT_617361 [Schizopora paradoxa]|uniref:Uncharacterized protein n=1 Tax=Schizopora paradoxa TaxID=27342 RepID=A0A0H2R9Z8_9AGAM|nr:hypothetical protein SCHPADRAFT_617361 [Schizopora paradoxa]